MRELTSAEPTHPAVFALLPGNPRADPAYAEIRFELMMRSFGATAFAVDTGSGRVGEY